MPKEVNGFLADDGTFFSTKIEALRYEAKKHLIHVVTEDGMSEEIIDWINSRRREISDYLNAGLTSSERLNAKRNLRDSEEST